MSRDLGHATLGSGKFRIILTMLYICFNGKNQNSLDDGDLSMLMGTHTEDYQMFFVSEGHHAQRTSE